MSINKKKVATTATALGLAGLMLFGGTYAWQSISQTALNEASDVINPGGRLHDDFNGENKDVYVENFAEENIYARIRLDEYFEIVQKVGTTEKVHTIAGSKDSEGNIDGWSTHYFDQTNATDEYWDWLTGGSTVFVPTFNKNKDSLVADINGTYYGPDNTITDLEEDDRYTDYKEYTEGETVDGEEIYDADTNDYDEVGNDFENLTTYVDAENIVVESATHEAKETLTAELISMDEWETVYGSQPGDYWVYDTDGWVYWANPIKPGEATGLLLDGISLDNVMDDSWYYAINVVAQFITADDLGKEDGTGFYDTTAGTEPTDRALALLEAIGVNVNEETNDAPETVYLELNYSEDAEIDAKCGDSIVVSINADDVAEYGDGDLSNIRVVDNDVYEDLIADEDYTYDSSTNTLVMLNSTVSTVKVYDNSSLYAGYINLEGSGGSGSEVVNKPLDITIQYADGTFAGTPPMDPETGEFADGITQIFAIGMENKDLYLGGKLTLEDGTVINSTDADSDLDVTFSFIEYESNMTYTFNHNDIGDEDYTFSISTIEDESSPYYGYKVAVCDQTNEQLAVLNENTGHLKMLAEDQAINQIFVVVANTNYNGVDYESVDWTLFFINRDIMLYVDSDDDSYSGEYTPGTEANFNLTGMLLFENEEVTDYTLYPLTWTVLDEYGNDASDVVTVTPYEDGKKATVTVSENATAQAYTVKVSYTHTADDGKNKGLYDSLWSIYSTEEPVELGYVKVWEDNTDIDNTEPLFILTPDENSKDDDTVYYWVRFYDTNDNIINDIEVSGANLVEDFSTNFTDVDDNFTDPYYEWRMWGESGNMSVTYNGETYYFSVSYPY